MVALLCAANKADGAVHLEQLWNSLAEWQRFSLFCAYPLNSLGSEPDADALIEICAEHVLTIPAKTLRQTFVRAINSQAIRFLEDGFALTFALSPSSPVKGFGGQCMFRRGSHDSVFIKLFDSTRRYWQACLYGVRSRCLLAHGGRETEHFTEQTIFCTRWSERVYMAFAPFKVEFSPGRIASGAGGR